MSEIVENPFGGFNLLNDSINAKATETKSDKKTAVAEALTSDEEIEGTDDETTAIADAELEKVAKKQAEAASKKSKAVEEVVEEDESEEDVQETVTETSEESSLKPFYSYLAEKGVLDEVEEFEDSEEGLEKVVNQTVYNRLNQWKSQYGEDGLAFLEFIENGGNPADFHKYYYSDNSWEYFSTESENEQKIIIREGLKLSGWEADEIDEEIELYEDTNKLKVKADQMLKKLQRFEKESKAQLVEQQKELETRKKQAAAEQYKKLESEWYSKDELKGFKLNKNLKDKVWDTIYKVDRRTGKTKLQEAYEKDVDTQFLAALMVAIDFDIKQLEKQVETKATSKLRKTLSNYSDSRGKLGSGRTERESDTSTGFDAFRKLM